MLLYISRQPTPYNASELFQLIFTVFVLVTVLIIVRCLSCSFRFLCCCLLLLLIFIRRFSCCSWPLGGGFLFFRFRRRSSRSPPLGGGLLFLRFRRRSGRRPPPFGRHLFGSLLAGSGPFVRMFVLLVWMFVLLVWMSVMPWTMLLAWMLAPFMRVFLHPLHSRISWLNHRSLIQLILILTADGVEWLTSTESSSLSSLSSSSASIRAIWRATASKVEGSLLAST